MLINAVIGAAATLVLSFTFFSPLAGGAFAGYLQKRNGVRVGALSGLIAAVVLLPFSLGFAYLLAGGLSLTILITYIIPLAVVLYTLVLSALGGFLGVYLAQETDL